MGHSGFLWVLVCSSGFKWVLVGSSGLLLVLMGSVGRVGSGYNVCIMSVYNGLY